MDSWKIPALGVVHMKRLYYRIVVKHKLNTRQTWEAAAKKASAFFKCIKKSVSQSQ